MDDWRTVHVNTNNNEADLLPKVLPFGEKMRKFVRKALMRIYGSSQITCVLVMVMQLFKRHSEHHIAFVLFDVTFYFILGELHYNNLS